jgi:hypothetical protein
MNESKILTKDDIQGIHKIEHKFVKGVELWIVQHLQTFDKQGGQLVKTIGHKAPISLGTLWNRLSATFIEIGGADQVLWKECCVSQVFYPIASKKGDAIKIKAVNPSAYGMQNFAATADWAAIPVEEKKILEAVETCVINWLIERSVQNAKAPVQISLLDDRLVDEEDEEEQVAERRNGLKAI